MEHVLQIVKISDSAIIDCNCEEVFSKPNHQSRTNSNFYCTSPHTRDNIEAVFHVSGLTNRCNTHYWTETSAAAIALRKQGSPRVATWCVFTQFLEL
jgi:hypothetical protein